MKKKIFAVLLLSVFVFGAPIRANAEGVSVVSEFANKVAITLAKGIAITDGILGGIGGIITIFGKKAFSNSGPKCPLLPFVRR